MTLDGVDVDLCNVAVYIGLNVGLSNGLYVNILVGLINENIGIFGSLDVGFDIGIGISSDGSCMVGVDVGVNFQIIYCCGYWS